MQSDIWRLYKAISIDSQIAIDYISAIAAIDDDNPNNVARQLLRKWSANRDNCLSKIRECEIALSLATAITGEARDLVEESILGYNRKLERLDKVKSFLLNRYSIETERKQALTLAQALKILRNE